MKKIGVLSIVALLLAGTPVMVCHAGDDGGKGAINWTEGFVEATGYGTAHASGNKGKDRINARRAAEASAQRALLETIKGVRIDSMTTVENSMLKEDHIKTRVDGIIKGAQTVEDKVEWEGNSPVAMIKMRVCLNGGMSECKGTPLINALDLEKKPEPAFVPQRTLMVAPAPAPERAVVRAAEPPAPVPAAAPAPAPRAFVCDLTKPVTGVVFSLEGRYFEKALLPVVVTQSSTDGMVTVYSAKVVKPSVIRTYGAVRYSETVDNAVKVSQLGGNILVVPVADITKENMIVINPRDAATIKETLAHGNDYLGDAKVVISVR